jgi:hypothetical protein
MMLGIFNAFNADFHGGKSINIFAPREAHEYWKTSESFCNHGIV